MTASVGVSWVIWSVGLFAVVTGIALLFGFLTPVAGTFASLGYLFNGVSQWLAPNATGHLSALSTLDLFVMSLALVLLGPGAFSLDARLFGHREVIIPDSGRSHR